MSRRQQPRAIALTQARSRGWLSETHNTEARETQVLLALLPAAFILSAATILMLVLL